ncbi:hypothetical protein PR048_028628 [Dryococelus australis]|uniref:Uncharacterized protein n=1 Tax=Dryococelus australis TaxID=614101 RepID=A0ABQ9GB36_9NEOP|nr:hypothetical protein PR048_028628 [Dryococelus australis]
MVVLFAMLNIAGINSQIFYFGNGNPDLGSRRHYIRQLAVHLVENHMARRIEIKTLPKHIVEKLNRDESTSAQEVQDNHLKYSTSRKRRPEATERDFGRSRPGEVSAVARTKQHHPPTPPPPPFSQDYGRYSVYACGHATSPNPPRDHCRGVSR